MGKSFYLSEAQFAHLHLGDCSHEIKRHFAPWKKSYDKPRQRIKKQRYHFANRGLYSQSYGFSSSHIKTYLCFFFLELFFLSRRGELLSDLLNMGSETGSFSLPPSLAHPTYDPSSEGCTEQLQQHLCARPMKSLTFAIFHN